MKKRFRAENLISKKSVILAAVSLVLVMILTVGTTISWIEEVSHVDFSSTDGQQTPLHVGDKVLNSDAVIKRNPESVSINLNDYFYKSGEMHLSPCYGDGEKFYFPVEGGTTGFREGTKDDVNVNYMSATFKIRSENANTAYWFEKSGNNNDTPYISFKKGATDVNDSTLAQYLRCSVTIDGATNVYALNSNGKFKTVSGSPQAVTTSDGRRIDQYTYYQEAFNNSSPEGYYKASGNTTNKPNQGGGDNLNGNTVFNVNKYVNGDSTTVKTVTVKIWLEYNNYVSSAVDVAAVNMNFVSSWAKTRRVYVKDATVYQEGYDSAKWLSTYNGALFFALKSNLNNHWLLERVSNTDYYYADIPAVYNNAEVVFLRCGDQTNTGENAWGKGDNDKNLSDGTNSIKYWNKWDTFFPDSFHSEVYTVYSTDFATWDPADNVHSVYVVNSAFFNNMYDYMWDSNSVISGQTDVGGVAAKVVKNAEWPGLKMTTQMKTKTSSQSLNTYAFFYNSDYDRIIFDDGDFVSGVNQEYQTQDLWLTDENGDPLDLVNGTFDMATLTWFHTNPTKNDWSSKMPSYTDSQTYIYGNFSTNGQWKKTRLAYGGEYGTTSGNAFNGTNNNTSTRKLLCKVYIKHSGSYALKLCFENAWYGANNSGNYDVDFSGSGTKEYQVENNNSHTHNLELNNVPEGVMRIYVQNGDASGKMKLYFAHGEN